MNYKKVAIVLLLSLVMLSGCKGKNDNTVSNVEASESLVEETKNTENNSDVKNDEVKVPEKEEDLPKEEIKIEDVVSEAINLKGSYDISFGESDVYTFEYDYVIPEIIDGSPDSKKINNDIYNEIKNSLEYVKDVKDGKTTEIYEADLRKVEYNCNKNGDIISIIVTKHGSFSDWTDYSVFNYDVVNQKIVSNDELIKAGGYTEDEFIKYCRNTVSKAASENLAAFTGNATDENITSDEFNYFARIMPSLINDCINSICDDEINTGMQIYLDENGELNVVAAIYVPAGAGLYYSTFKVDSTIGELATLEYKEYAEKLHYDGFEHDCMNLYEGEGYSYDTVSGGKDRYYYLGYTGKEDDVFLFQDSFTEGDYGYSGTIKWEDFDEKGSIYSFELTTLNGKDLPESDIKTGKFYMLNHSKYDEETDTFDDGATYRYIEGFDLFESDGEEVYISRSQG